MMTTTPKRYARQAIARSRFVFAAALIALLAACGSSGGASPSSTQSSGGSGVAKAQAATVAAENAPTGFRAPGPAFDAKKLAGKSIWVVQPLSIPLSGYIEQGLHQAAALVGVSIHPCDGAAEVTPTVRCMEEAIAAHANLIYVQNVGAPSLTTQIAAARAAGIPVVTAESQDPGPVASYNPPGVVATTDQCHACAGKLMADATIALSAGKAHAVVIWSSDVSDIGTPQLNAIKSEFNKRCPACTVQVVDVPLPQWSTELGTETRSIIASHPDVNYLLPLYDGMAIYMAPAVAASGASARVHIVSYNATPAVMQDLANKNVMAADVGSNALEWGWYWADQAFRVLAGVAPSLNEAPPIRVFTATNIGSINVHASQTTWYGNANYEAAFKSLWGLG